jgi:uncharacterized protein (TIGR03437 family)
MASGVWQLNVKVPESAPSGDAPLIVTAGAASSDARVTVAVK